MFLCFSNLKALVQNHKKRFGYSDEIVEDSIKPRPATAPPTPSPSRMLPVRSRALHSVASQVEDEPVEVR